MWLTKVLHKISQYRHDATIIWRITQILVWVKKQINGNDHHNERVEIVCQWNIPIKDKLSKNGQSITKWKDIVSLIKEAVILKDKALEQYHERKILANY